MRYVNFTGRKQIAGEPADKANPNPTASSSLALIAKSRLRDWQNPSKPWEERGPVDFLVSKYL
jgi:hypothetical protein